MFKVNVICTVYEERLWNIYQRKISILIGLNMHANLIWGLPMFIIDLLLILFLCPVPGTDISIMLPKMEKNEVEKR
ncbi:hypothetical protein [Neisseria sp. 20925_1_37]|uniref:hypothetical protein n=1 Tax=Neisseria sp. 20925_1_37 TaxID=3003683 RepID=UPI00352D68CC